MYILLYNLTVVVDVFISASVQTHEVTVGNLLFGSIDFPSVLKLLSLFLPQLNVLYIVVAVAWNP